MTIYTPSQGEKKNDKECTDPEVVTEPLVEPEDVKVVKVAKTMYVSYFQRNQRNFLFHTFITLMVLMILTCGAIGASILYRHLNKRVSNVYAGRCGNVFYDKTYHDDSSMRLRDPMALEKSPEDFVEESIVVSDIDMYEHLYTAQFDEVRENHVWHDFFRNYTVIVDNAWRICYLMKLNRTAIAPPRDVIDFIDKLMTGYYMPNAEVIREKYVVITPPVTNTDHLGKKFRKNCAKYDTYLLHRFDSGLVKRSVDSPRGETATYALFSNKIDRQVLFKLLVLNPQKNL